MWVTKQLLVPIDFHSIEETFGLVTNILQNKLCCVQQKNKDE